MAKKKIGVILNMPTTEEGKAKLREAAIAFNSRMIANVLNKYPDIPYEAKVRFVESLNGIVPWPVPKEG